MNHVVEVTASVTITPAEDAPADWLTRVSSGDFPYRSWDGSPLSAEEGLEHLAYNAVANGVEDASRLDGWGDLDAGMLTLRVHDVEAER